MVNGFSAWYRMSPLTDVALKSLWRKVSVAFNAVKSEFCCALPDLVDTLTSKEKSDRGMPSSVVVDWAYSVTLPASSLTSTSVGSQLMVTGT